MTRYLAASPTRQGIFLMLVASFCFTLMDSVAKGLVQTYPAPLVFGARFIGMLLIVLVILRGSALSMAWTSYPAFHLLRAAMQFGATAFFFTSLSQIGLAEATAIADVAPVLITFGAALFLGERLGPGRIFGVVAAMFGALIIIRPGLEVFSPAALFPMAAAICYAGNVLLTRRLGPHESAWTPMILASAFCTIAGGIWASSVWVPIHADDFLAFAMLGCLGTLTQLFLIRAFTLAEASVIAPFAYVTILFAGVWGVLFHDEWPDGWTILGALVIVAAGLYVWHREGNAARSAELGRNGKV